MSAALIVALVFTVILLVITAYFLMGSVPLLVLKHDTPLDSRFVRGFFNTYYLAAIFTAGATAASYAFAGKWVFAAGATGLALLATLLRRTVAAALERIWPEEGEAGTGLAAKATTAAGTTTRRTAGPTAA